MNKKEEAMNKIREQLKKLMSFAAEPETPSVEAEEDKKKFETLKCKDGLECVIPDGSKLEVGTPVSTLDESGMETPLENGPYELESGETIVITDGLIESVATTSPEAPVEETPVEDACVPEKKMGDMIPEIEEGIEEEEDVEMVDGEIGKRVADLESQIAQILELLQGMSNAQEVAMSKINEINSAPGAPSIKVGKSLATGSIGSIKNEMDELKKVKNKFNLGTKY